MIKIIIHTGNAAFADGQKDLEVARILEEAATKVVHQWRNDIDFKLYDVNGNAVGRFAELDDDDMLPTADGDCVQIEIATDNAAFEDNDKCEEIARILRGAAEKVRDRGDYDFKLRDINGNTVGFLRAPEPEARNDGGAVAPANDLRVLLVGSLEGGFHVQSVLSESAVPDAVREVMDSGLLAEAIPFDDNNHEFDTDPDGTEVLVFGTLGDGFAAFGPFLDGAVALEAAETIRRTWDVPYEIATIGGPAAEEAPQPLFGYYINLDERGSFYADVRDEKGKTVFEIKAGNELAEDESSIFDDGFMRNKNDVSGLESHLRDLGVIPPDGQVLPADAFERHLDARAEDDEPGMEP